MVDIYVMTGGEDDPSMCTAEKLVKKGLAKRITRVRDIPYCSIVLNPLAYTYIKYSDRYYVDRCGITAIDISWKRGIERLKSIRRGLQRVIPILIAVNPVNYGKPFKLSTAEAIAAALYITGFKDYATEILKLFKWGEQFVELNKERLEIYSRAKDDNEIELIEMSILGINGENLISKRVIDLLHRLAVG